MGSTWNDDKLAARDPLVHSPRRLQERLVQLAADEAAFADARSARACAERLETAGGKVESIERRPIDLEYLFHSLVQNDHGNSGRR